MKTKRIVKKLADVPDRLRKVLYRTLRKSKSALLRTHFVRTLRRLGRMEVGRALRLFVKFAHFQLTIRPRIKLVAAVILLLLLALIGTGRGAVYLHSKESEIKVMGQPIRVAETHRRDEQSQIDSEIVYKETPFDFSRPVTGYVSQGFRNYHRAIDIATGAVGVPIHALGKGRVESAGMLFDGKGNVVVVDHGDGIKSLYAHMGKINVGVGNEVDSNTTLGTVGLTGHTTGAHVHLEIYDNGIAVDPEKILPSQN